MELLLHLDRAAGTPLWRQLYEQLRDAMLDGKLRAGERLPSSRMLAASLHVSRNLILEAYEQLVAEGYLESRPQSGMVVTAGLYRVPQVETDPPDVVVAMPVSPDLIDFRPGLPALDLVPAQQWGRLLQTVCAESSPETWGYGPPEGDVAVRAALCRYLERARGVRATPQQVVMTTGAAQGFALITHVLLGAGDLVAVEEPMTAAIRRRYAAANVRFFPVPMDEHGLDVGRLPQSEQPRLIHVTPSHQFPLGAVLPIARRLALLAYAGERSSLVVEDDYDSEVRYSGAPVPALQGLAPDRVIYVGTLSKVLAPALRLGYLIVPTALIEVARAAKRQTDLHSSRLDHLALARFIEEGRLDRHVTLMRRAYRRRRDALLAALATDAPQPYNVLGASTGLHMVVRWPGRRFDEAWCAATAQRGVRVYRVEQHALVPGHHEDQIILGYGHLTPEQIARGVAQLGAVMGAHRS